MKALGDAATDLVWLAPASSSLVALARAPFAASWPQIRVDPGAVLLLARASERQPEHRSLAALVADPFALESALTLLSSSSAGFVDWSQPGPACIHRQALRQAHVAEALATKLDVDREKAWVGALLAPLGWLALAAVAPDQIEPSLARVRSPSSNWQQELWGLDHTAIARRLGRWWRLPAWLTPLLGHLGLHVDIAQRLGAEPRLFQVVQLAVALAQEQEPSLGLAVGADLQQLCANLGVDSADLEGLLDRAVEFIPAASRWEPPLQQPLLLDLLRLSLENRRQVDPTWVERLQTDLDYLQKALEDQCRLEKERLHSMKLSALAELAAGAGHEINNPLAVISGQAQYAQRQLQQLESVLVEEPELAALLDPVRDKVGHALQAIVGQSQRIHHVLTDLMQFARPSAPKPQVVNVAELVRDVCATLAELAQVKKVRLACPDVPADLCLEVDPHQARTALTNLFRNAVEAAPADGWAGIRVERGGDRLLRFIVEDNGPGPNAAAREHLFDPFYSGRNAGRGRGFGLSTAWRYARQHQGDIHFEGHEAGTTRFVLSLPEGSSANTPLAA